MTGGNCFWIAAIDLEQAFRGFAVSFVALVPVGGKAKGDIILQNLLPRVAGSQAAL
ncbi:hypothetical protein [Pseudophaeobacter sp.]|uniref:hypothetical protein n=1 Tax=Pseudophaeobacter sp. TaxID=1971739 RepID=UPI00329900EC